MKCVSGSQGARLRMCPQFIRLFPTTIGAVVMAASSTTFTSPWRPSARPWAARRCLPRLRDRLAARSTSEAGTAVAERELLSAINSLGYPASIFPGDEQQRASIDRGIEQLEAANPTPSPLLQQQPGAGGQPSSLLLGDWQLVYASSGTYVTRTAAAQALLAASKLPGVGVADIYQALQLQAADGQLRTSNAACFGLGPFGEWEVCINGVWDVQDGSLARVSFDGFTLQLVGLLGLIKLPSMAKVSVPIKDSVAADFYTTYLSEDVRIARGKSRNIFLFQRRP